MKRVDRRLVLLAILKLLDPDKRDLEHIEAAYIIIKEELKKLGYEVS